jgi:hypothetical protein
LQRDSIRLVPPVIRPFGFLLLLAALRWRMPEARLLLATAFVPQNILPYELVSLALIPANRMEMWIYIAGTWLAVGLADRLNPGLGIAEWAGASWPAMLCAGYLPMLVLVLRRPSGVKAPRVGKERRRPHRLKDTELRVEVTPNPAGGVTAKVTHLPTKKSAAESGPTREAAVRKAQDRLAGILAGNREERKEA